MFKCDNCKEEFIEEEMVFLCGDVIIDDIERYDDYDRKLCSFCYDDIEEEK